MDKEAVKVGDKVSLMWDEANGSSTLWVEAEVIGLKESRKKKYGSGWKYHLKLLDGTNSVVKTRLIHLKWKLLSSHNKKLRSIEWDEECKNGLGKSNRVSGSEVPRSIKKIRATISFSESSLRYIVAPMVGASELAFRLLCRKYGSTLAYTPMMNSERFANDLQYREEEFQTCLTDRPLVAHFSANDPQSFLAAAKLVESNCDAIGCPQRVAFVGHFGSFLLDEVDRPLVLNLVRIVADHCSVPIFVKIRLLDNLEDTIKLCQQLVEAGASLIAIHGRYRVNLVNRTGPGARDGPAHLDQIKAIREVITSVPIISNGNVRCWSDVINNLAFTGAAGIMSAEGLLDDPALFNNGHPVEPLQLATEYLDLVDLYPVKLKSVIFHIRRMCKEQLTKFQLMDECINANSIDEVRLLVQNMAHFQKTGNFVQDPKKATREKEAEERRKREEGKRKDFEARMIRKAKREGKPLDYYLSQGSTVPTLDEVKRLKAMMKEDAFEIWKKSYSQHCWSFHFDVNGCQRDRKCSFLHSDIKANNDVVVYG